MYGGDTLEVVNKASRLFSDDPRVTQFYDPEKITGVEVAAGLGAKTGEIAWDIYLFFDRHAEWTDRLPMPIDWVHQLGGSSWAEPGRFYQGQRLALKLREIMESIFDN